MSSCIPSTDDLVIQSIKSYIEYIELLLEKNEYTYIEIASVRGTHAFVMDWSKGCDCDEFKNLLMEFHEIHGKVFYRISNYLDTLRKKENIQ